MELGRRATPVVAFAVFLVAATVYMITLTPTVPFWDAGEFIAVAKILGVPHPPGTPFYVMIARLFTLIPWATVAQRVNALSAISSALAIMFTYLCGVRLIRGALGDKLTPGLEWMVHVGAASGALMLAFSDNFWENSIEAEVYQMMSLATVLVLWLGLRWYDEHAKRPSVGLLLAAVYVMWVSVGLHLGVGVMGLPVLALLFVHDRRLALLFSVPYLSILLCTAGLERMAGALLILSTLVFVVYAWNRQLNGMLVAICGLVAVWGMYIAFSDATFDFRSGTIATLSVVVPLTVLAIKRKEGRILALALALMVIGYSNHLYLPIRAAQHPAVNEGDPSTWPNLRDLLERKQYGQMNMFVRKSGWGNQLNKEFWRYFSRQWPVLPFRNDGLASIIALTLGLVGAGWQARRDLKRFVPMFVFFGLNTAGLIVFLNFSDHEVRDRDYFFQSGYHAFALWIAVGSVWLMLFVRDAFAEKSPARRWVTGATAVLLLLQPFILMKREWFPHDRRGNYIARDYAYNMLAPLAPNSFMFTNGDNDTFPLWYIQEVEGVRKDVRIVNMSLLNTDWYIKQLRDEEPKVPIKLDDATIKALGQGYVQDPSGKLVYTNEYMVQHIINDADRRPDGSFIKQPYFAVTVPDHVGLDKNFTLEGLVYRVNPDTTGPELDVAATRKALYHTFLYRGLFKADGSWDSTVYKDENSETLSRNYAAAHIQLAFDARKRGDLPGAIAEMERVKRMFPSFTEILMPLGQFYLEAHDTTKALALYEDLARRNPDDAEAVFSYGLVLAFHHEPDKALQQWERAMQLDPNLNSAYFNAFYLEWDRGHFERALGYLERWLDGHPEDTQARAFYEQRRREVGGRGLQPQPLLPKPPGPGMTP